MVGEAVPPPGKGGDIVGGVVAEGGVVALPIAVESYLPNAVAGESDGVGGPGTVREIDDHDDVVAGPALRPTVEGQDLVGVVDMEDIPLVPAQTGGDPVQVPAEADEIAVEVANSPKGIEL